MKSITRSEFNRIAGVLDARGVYEALKGSRAHQGVFVSKEEWKFKTNPANAINSYASNHNTDGVTRLKVSQAETSEGWALIRN